MKKPKVAVIVGYGINCDRELAEAFERAGAYAERVHLKELIEGKIDIRQYHIIAIPGGFSFGDDTFGGNIFAKKIIYSQVKNGLRQHLNDGKLVFGVCNGNQIVTVLNLVPVFEDYFSKPEVAFTNNDSARYEDRGNVHLKVVSHKSHWLKGIDILHNIPTGHGEGKFYTTDDVLRELYARDLVALKYCHEDGTLAEGKYPISPNGSVDDIAGLASEQVLVLMPHPERAMEPYNQAGWTRKKSVLKRQGLALPEDGDGMYVFRNGVEYVKNNVI
jgi:phosphoribosylformylglycinamidine synthase